MKDYFYFKNLTPRQQLNDLIHKYAQITNGKYGDAWRELDKRWKQKTGTSLSLLRWKYNQQNNVKLTTPVVIERAGKMKEALVIAHEMTGNILLGSIL